MQPIPSVAKSISDVARIRTAGRYHSEVYALAKILNTTWRNIMLANISYDLTLAKIGCSTVVLPSPTGPIIGRNMDWWPEDLLA